MLETLVCFLKDFPNLGFFWAPLAPVQVGIPSDALKRKTFLVIRQFSAPRTQKRQNMGIQIVRGPASMGSAGSADPPDFLKL